MFRRLVEAIVFRCGLCSNAFLRIAEEESLFVGVEMLKQLRYLLVRRIYTTYPHFKFQRGSISNFVDFMVSECDSDLSGVLLDLGAHDGYFAHEVISRLPSVQFVCVDNIEQPNNYFSDRIAFHNIDILSWLKACSGSEVFDAVVLSGTLSLFSAEDRKQILAWVRNQGRSLFLREVPRYSDMVDVYVDMKMPALQVYDLFTETTLSALLQSSGFTVVRFLRDTDYFVHALPDRPDTKIHR